MNTSDVGTFTCADSDTNTATFGALTYSIESGDTSSQFSVDSANNKLQTHSSNNIDYDSGDTMYEMVIKLVDNNSGTPKNSATITAIVVVSECFSYILCQNNAAFKLLYEYFIFLRAQITMDVYVRLISH